MRFALFGDIGGHLQPFVEGLTTIGADPATGRIPPGLVIIQVGDLIDRGPDSDGCVAIVDRFLAGAPDQWIQLFGNHEGNLLGGPRFWDEPHSDATQETLERWWVEGTGRMATAVRSATDGELLVTHGGLVAPLWELLGRPGLACAVETMNGWVGARPDLAFAPGGLLGSGGVPGPAWPDAATELYGSWESVAAVPFGQVHGHSSIGDWHRGRVRRSTPRWLRQRAVVDAASRHERVVIGGRPFVGIDPTLGQATSVTAVCPLIVEGDLIA
ncbi:MAG: hypothetical protein NVSMB12_20650 [Acidimicrobiales bacterium]